MPGKSKKGGGLKTKKSYKSGYKKMSKKKKQSCQVKTHPQEKSQRGITLK